MHAVSAVWCWGVSHLCALANSLLPPSATQPTSSTAHTTTYARCATTTPAADAACWNSPTLLPAVRASLLSAGLVVTLLLAACRPLLVLWLLSAVACAAVTVGCGCCCACWVWGCARTAAPAAAGSFVHCDAIRLPRSSSVSCTAARGPDTVQCSSRRHTTTQHASAAPMQLCAVNVTRDVRRLALGSGGSSRHTGRSSCIQDSQTGNCSCSSC